MAIAKTDDFSVEVKAVVNLNEQSLQQVSQKVQTVLKSSTQKMRLEADGTQVITLVNTLTDKFGNLYKQVQEFNKTTGKFDTSSIERVSQSVQDLTTEFTKFGDKNGDIVKIKESYDSAGQTIITKTRESTQAIGGFLQQTQKITTYVKDANGNLDKMGNTVTKINNIVAQVTTTTTKNKEIIQDAGKSYQALVTTTDKVYSNGERLKIITTQYTNDLGQLVEEIKKVDAQGNQVGTTVRNVTETTDKFTTISAKLVTVLADGTQIIKERNDLGQKLVTTIKEEDNGMGMVTKTTKVYNETLQKTESVTKEVIYKTAEYQQLQKEIVTTTTKEEKYVDDLGKRYKALVETKTQVLANGKQLKTVTTTYTDELGRTVTVVKQLDENGKPVANTIRNISSEMQKGTSIGQRFSDIIVKVSKFYLATLPIRTFQKAITDAVQTVKDFDAAITEMAKVADHSGESLKQYANDLATLGQDVARTKTEMVEAATGWIKAGYSDEDAAQLAKFSALLQNTADEELSGAEATSILVSQLKAYHMEANEAIKVTDIINQVSADFAVSSGDISKGLTVASASMATFGNSIEQTTALLTAGTTIFQNKSQQVARGLNMIATRVAKASDDLAEYGVAVKDASGELRSTYDILVDLKPAWDKMSSAEKVALGNTLAGTNQYKIFAAVMSQMDTAVKAYEDALSSSGATMKQNEIYMQSLEA